MEFQLKPGFLLGAASAAAQIEGGVSEALYQEFCGVTYLANLEGDV